MRFNCTIDLLFIELVASLLWFNPIILLIKRCARENHEFLADAPAGASKDSLLEYLECLRTETIRVSSGEIVRKGALIGTVGSIGQSTGPHLHYEVLKGDKHVNPSDYY